MPFTAFVAGIICPSGFLKGFFVGGERIDNVKHAALGVWRYTPQGLKEMF